MNNTILKTPETGSTKKKRTKYEPIYEKDPITGKIIPLPLPEDLWKRTKLSDKKSSEKRRPRRITNLQPLILTEADFEETVPIKKRKLEIEMASKDISKPKRISERLSNTFQAQIFPNQNNGTKSFNSKRLTLKKEPDKSPLVNLEDVEEELLNTKSALKGFSFRFPKSVPQKFNFSKVTPKKVSTPRMSTISEELDINDTFTENELKCMTPSNLEKIVSKNNVNHMVDIIENVIKKQEDAFVVYTKVHQENMKELHLLLNLCTIRTGKENVKGKLITTPKSVKNENLRKNVLRKNLQNELQSPRTRGALSLYNSLRSSNSSLTTPKFNRKAVEESPGKVLSDALMKQCLLLQTTPIHK